MRTFRDLPAAEFIAIAAAYLQNTSSITDARTIGVEILARYQRAVRVINEMADELDTIDARTATDETTGGIHL